MQMMCGAVSHVRGMETIKYCMPSNHDFELGTVNLTCPDRSPHDGP